ncbi:hypothetical protein [Streptomyces sp. t39]|nr:hypothetical protein [Streptomyces sp. t39]
MIKRLINALATLASTCPNGHKSVISLPNGQRKCMDCGWQG